MTNRSRTAVVANWTETVIGTLLHFVESTAERMRIEDGVVGMSAMAVLMIEEPFSFGPERRGEVTH